VIGTIWSVRDDEAAALAERFYAHASRGETARAALAAAQRELIAAGAPPAAWAGFVLIGDGGARLPPRARPSSRTPPATTVLAGSLALAVVVGLAWLRLRKR
jgi:hypothetical protein